MDTKFLSQGIRPLWPCIAILAATALLAQFALAIRNGWQDEPAYVLSAKAVSIDKTIPQKLLPVKPAPINHFKRGELLVDAIIEVESRGDPTRVGGSGERGLMQIKSGTWADITKKMFGRKINFDRAFQPDWNRRVGRGYLAHLQTNLKKHQDKWLSDERSLVLAAYNAGPGRLEKGAYNLDRMPLTTKDYVARVIALHDLYLSRLMDQEEEWVQRPTPVGETAQVVNPFTLGS